MFNLERPPVCNHPDLRPTDWLQKKPEPCAMHFTSKAAGWYCPICKRSSGGEGWKKRGEGSVGRLAQSEEGI